MQWLTTRWFSPFLPASVGNSLYNSLQLKVTHRLSHGLQVQGAYTWAHAIDDSNDPYSPAVGNRAFARNSRDLNEERGNSDNDIRHVAVISYVWEVPFGKGKRFLNSGFVGQVFEGWQFSGITSAQTGHPFDVFSSTDMERTGLSGRADIVGDPYAPGANTASNAGGNKVWFTNPDAFSGRTDGSGAPLFDGPGSSGRNQLLRTGLCEFRSGVFQDGSKFTERFNAELRVEGYNIFNHPHFENPGFDGASNRITASNFGMINATSTSSRRDYIGAADAGSLEAELLASTVGNLKACRLPDRLFYVGASVPLVQCAALHSQFFQHAGAGSCLPGMLPGHGCRAMVPGHGAGP